MTHTIDPHSLKSDRAIRFGRELSRAMKARGVGARTIQESVGVGRSAVGNWRQGRNLPRTETAKVLAQALDWPRLATLAAELRSRPCVIDGVVFVDDSGTDNRLYCSWSCRNVAEKRADGSDRTLRAAVAERRLTVHQRAVEAFCGGCEPSGRCVTAECSLRPVSPLPLYLDSPDVDRVQPKPPNGLRAPGADAARSRKVWASHSPEERAARAAKATAARWGKSA